MRVTLVANELRGFYPAGGMGTATTFLALALARMGHSVQILAAWEPKRALDEYWAHVYAEAGVEIRRADQSRERAEPRLFGVMRNVELALRADPPDVVVTHDLNAPAYSALRLRQLGLGFADVLFVVFCHGTRRWVTEMSGKTAVPDMRDVLADGVLEQASVELADVVVSPSAYLIGWMREQGWQLPGRIQVIPYFTRSGATGEPPPERAEHDAAVERLAFFGRFEDKKGIRTFVEGLNRLSPQLLRGVEVAFLGKTTTTWTEDRIAALVAPETRRALLRLSFETKLDQHEALARLSLPGTLAVMPSLGDNSPNTVYECLERGIPFIASAVGGIPELVAPEDHARVLFPPTAAGVEAALRRVLPVGVASLRPARPAFDAAGSLAAWGEVLETHPAPPPPERAVEEQVDVIVVRGNVGVEEARASSLRSGTAPFVLFLADDDVPDERLVQTLLRAQRISAADVVSCAVQYTADDGNQTIHFFSGAPGGLGALSNDYGTVALIRRALLDEVRSPWPAEADPDWPLLAGLAASGARIVSVPLPLVTQTRQPGRIKDAPADALLVLEQLERGAPDGLRLVPRLVAGLGEVTKPNSTTVQGTRARTLARRAIRALLRASRPHR